MQGCYSLARRTTLYRHGNTHIMMCMDGTGPKLSNCLLICGIGGLIRNIWRGGPNELHQSVRILLHLTQFCTRRQVHYPQYGPSEHVPPHVWKSTEATVEDDTQDDVGEEVDICALCCQKHTTTECGECHLHYCAECIDPHTCGEKTVC